MKDHDFSHLLNTLKNQSQQKTISCCLPSCSPIQIQNKIKTRYKPWLVALYLLNNTQIFYHLNVILWWTEFILNKQRYYFIPSIVRSRKKIINIDIILDAALFN